MRKDAFERVCVYVYVRVNMKKRESKWKGYIYKEIETIVNLTINLAYLPFTTHYIVKINENTCEYHWKIVSLWIIHNFNKIKSRSKKIKNKEYYWKQKKAKTVYFCVVSEFPGFSNLFTVI